MLNYTAQFRCDFIFMHVNTLFKMRSVTKNHFSLVDLANGHFSSHSIDQTDLIPLIDFEINLRAYQMLGGTLVSYDNDSAK